jgi:hypothetical protein
MEWDLGIKALGLLAGLSVVFGLAAELVFMWTTRTWIGVLGAVVYFLVGIFVSEVWFGWATEEDLQPNVDGLSFDEVFLLGTMLSWLVMGFVWLGFRIADRRHGQGHGPRHAQHRPAH